MHKGISLEKNDDEKIYVQPNTSVLSNCLTAVTMPKNWSQVERLKQQRLFLHQQLFAEKISDINNNEAQHDVEKNIENTTGIGLIGKNVPASETLAGLECEYYCGKEFDDGSESESSDEGTPRLQIAESNINVESDSACYMISERTASHDNFLESDGVISKNTNYKEQVPYQEKMETDNLSDESNECLTSSQKSLNSSDLCDLTASKINEALHNAIASVNTRKKNENNRIKQVLASLKMKAEEKETDSSGYRISKPMTTNAKQSRSSNELSHSSDKDLSSTEIKPYPYLTVAKSNMGISELDQTKYVGLSVDVKNVKAFDYKNIALQKFLAEKRLKEQAAKAKPFNMEKSSQEINGGEQVVEKSVKSDPSSIEPVKIETDNDCEYKDDHLQLAHSYAMQLHRQQSQGKKEMLYLSQQLSQQPVKAEGPSSDDLKEKILLAKQKMIKSREKMLEAEMNINQHQLKMVEKGIPIYPYLPHLFIQDSVTEEATDSEDDNKSDTKQSPVMKNHLPNISLKESNCSQELKNLPNWENNRLTLNMNNTKAQRKMSKRSTESKTRGQEIISDQHRCADTVMLQNRSAKASQTGQKSVQKLVRSSVSNKNVDSKVTVLPLKSKPEGQTKKTSYNRVSSTEKRKSSENRDEFSKSGKISKTHRNVSPVQKMAEIQDVAKGETDFKVSVIETQNREEIRPTQSLQQVMIPQATIQLTQVNSQPLHLQVSGNVQEPLPKHGQPNQTDKMFLPSGFVKDESTNRIFHTYRFNGHTFVMIDNKLYQINLKSTGGKTKPVVGALIPTTAAVISGNTRPRMMNEVNSRNPAPLVVSAPSVLRYVPAHTTSATAVKYPDNSITYRLPVNVTSSLGKTNQPLKLFVITTTPGCAGTQSTQVINKPLMNVTGGSNYVRAQLQLTLGQHAKRSNNVVAKTTGSGKSLQNLLQSAAFNSGSFVSTSATAVNKTLLPKLTETQSIIPQSASTCTGILFVSPSKSQQIYTTSQLVNSQISSPVVRSLLTNKTYVTANSAPPGITAAIKKVRMYPGVPTKNVDYCALKTALGQTGSVNRVAQTSAIIRTKPVLSSETVVENPNKATSPCLSSAVSKTVEQNISKVSQSNIKQTYEGASVKEVETHMNKASAEVLHQDDLKGKCSKNSQQRSSPATICSSMDSFIYTSKRKRKGTPVKKMLSQNATSSLQPQKSVSSTPLLLQDSLEEDDNIQKAQKDASTEEEQKNNKKNSNHSDKICDPVPFLDYPARIVSAGKSKSLNNMMEIVASPKVLKNGQNSCMSLDDEKMAKMISFAKVLEEEENSNGREEKRPERRKFKKRRTDSRKIAEESCTKMEVTDSDSDNKSQEVLEGVEKEDNTMKISTGQDNHTAVVVKDAENDTLKEPAVVLNKDLTHRERSMFDRSEELSGKRNFASDSNNDSDDLYDSSDMENYEKTVFYQKQRSAVMKPKSQLIESYYASQGKDNLSGSKSEPKQSPPNLEPRTLVTVERSSQNLTDLTKNKVASRDLEISSKTKQDGSEVSLKSSVNVITAEPACQQVIKEDTGQKANQQPLVTGGVRQVKKYIKTKFIILKGDICDRWFEIKRKTGFGEMSDPKFIHYLLRLEEERQTKMNQIKEAQIKNTDVSSVKQETIEEKSDTRRGIVDLNNNNNADRFFEEKEFSPVFDMEDTIVNVTDSPESSPRFSDISMSDIDSQDGSKKNCKLSDASNPRASNEEKSVVEMIETPTERAQEKVSHKGSSRKRHAVKREDANIPAAKKRLSILSDATQRQMRWAVSLFREWLKEKGEEDVQFEYKDSAWLDSRLVKFYTDALSDEETPYSTDILQCFRRSLSLYLSSDSSYQNVHISIAQDREYRKSNSALSCLMLKETRKSTLNAHERDVHPISEEDIKKLYTSGTLSDKSPTHLIWKVWFDITYHLCKGKLPRNFWRCLSKRSLVLQSDVNGVFYTFADFVYLPPDEEPGKMYATPDDPEKCPVRSTSFYLSKLSANCDALFQCCKKSWKNCDTWYCSIPMSRENLDKIISQISLHAGLSKVYDVSSVMLTAKKSQL